jgi:hypothetical protein
VGLVGSGPAERRVRPAEVLQKDVRVSWFRRKSVESKLIECPADQVFEGVGSLEAFRPVGSTVRSDGGPTVPRFKEPTEH